MLGAMNDIGGLNVTTRRYSPSKSRGSCRRSKSKKKVFAREQHADFSLSSVFVSLIL
jgi:hypothetical protein